MYGIQGLWSAAHQRIRSRSYCQQAQYKILKDCASVLPLPEMARHNYLGMDSRTRRSISSPGPVVGVEAHRVTNPTN